MAIRETLVHYLKLWLTPADTRLARRAARNAALRVESWDSRHLASAHTLRDLRRLEASRRVGPPVTGAPVLEG